MSVIDFIDRRMQEKFAAFENDRDPARIYEILDSMEAAESGIPIDDVAARNLAISHRLHFFALLDRLIDPGWNPRDLPVQGVAPPLSHGVIYGSGEVDPETIPDPEERAQYVEALKANKAAYLRYVVQMQLRRIDERAMYFIGRHLPERYPNPGRDNHEFEALLAASPVNITRRDRLRALMGTLAAD